MPRPTASGREEQQARAADGLRTLSTFAKSHGLGVIMNHGHLSSNGAWLAGVMRQVDMANCGTLPDFGNLDESSDRGVRSIPWRAGNDSLRQGGRRQVQRLRRTRQRIAHRFPTHDAHRARRRIPGLGGHRVRRNPNSRSPKVFCTPSGCCSRSRSIRIQQYS